ncbi:MAG TPA: hypothetical protein VE999_11560 [Gemmataceae bacterium]|nr:hypothetical protein [Bryobacteraceae bacterium]HZV05710.1 hypothetical protein [Gemmataceae bacterium]
MAITQADIDNFDALYKQGVRRFRFQDREEELHSAEDALKFRNWLVAEAAKSSGQQPVRQVRIYTTSGWGY